MRSTILRSTSLLCSIHPTSSQICTTHTATRFKTARVLVTGPSATADIEGVLIQGARDVRSLTVLPISRPERARAAP
jgi:L-lactate utilization protein LutC